MEQKRLMVFLPFLTFGGAERQGFLLAKGFKEQYGYEVEVWGFSLANSKYPLTADLEKAGIATRVLPFQMDVFRGRKSLLGAMWQFIALLRKSKFDVIIPFTYWPNFMTALASRFIGASCFWNQRSVDDHVPLKRLERFISFDRLTVVANSNSGKDFLHRRFGIPSEKIALIQNAVVPLDSINNKQYWRDSLGIDSGDLVITMVANFFPEKNFVTVLDGMKILRERGQQVVCVFCGEGPNRDIEDKVKAYAFDLRLQDHIRFIGSTADVRGLLEATDVGVLSTFSEGCPNSVLEYMSAGLAVVGSNIGPIGDVVGTDYPYLFDNAKAAEFADKIEALALDASLRTTVGASLKQKAEQEFSLQKMLEAFSSLILKTGDK